VAGEIDALANALAGQGRLGEESNSWAGGDQLGVVLLGICRDQ
jgi:hypothetical protein